MPLSISINTRTNTLQVEEGPRVVTEAIIDGGEDVPFKYTTKTFETLSCAVQIGTLEPTNVDGKAGKLVVSTSATVEAYTLTFSGTVKAGGQPSNVTFTLKKKSSGAKSTLKGKPDHDE